MKIEKTECSYQVTECDLKFGKQISLGGELLIPASILDKIRAEIDQKQYDFMADGDYNEGVRFGLMLAYQIIDKCRESEVKTWQD